MAVFGPDGAGKSAVIKRLAQELTPPFHAVQQFHFRPMFRQKWRERRAVTDPHAKSPRGMWVSIFKLLYWLADCWYGYLVTILPARANARLVIFDRYFDDILIDPRRYRLPPSSLWFARLFVRLAPRPDLYVLLDVPSDILQRRKAEVHLAESQRQRLEYLEMFRRLPNALTVDASASVEEVVVQVKILVLQSLADPSVNRAEVSLLADS
jgi:thymidylate kinase